MEHSFDIEIAKLYGIEEAIIIKNFEFWLAKNKANGKHLYENRTWTYNSVKAFGDLFPYMSDSKIRRTLDNLVEKGVLLKGNFNQSGYDRTLWYSFSDNFKMSKSICQNQQMDFAESSNGFGKNDEPIPDSNPDTDTNKKTYTIEQKIITYLNEKTKRAFKFKPTNAVGKALIQRLSEYGEEKLIRMIDDRFSKWWNDPKMNEYLCPDTLFRESNCNKYIAMLPQKQTLQDKKKIEFGVR